MSTDDPTLVATDPTLPNPEQLDRWTKAMDDTERLGPAINHHGGYEDRLANASLEAGYEREGIGPQQVLAEQDAIPFPKLGDPWTDFASLLPEGTRCRRTWNPDCEPTAYECSRREHDPAEVRHVAARDGKVVAVWNADGGEYESSVVGRTDTRRVADADPRDPIAWPAAGSTFEDPTPLWDEEHRGQPLCGAQWIVDGKPMAFRCALGPHRKGSPHIAVDRRAPAGERAVEAVWNDLRGEYVDLRFLTLGPSSEPYRGPDYGPFEVEFPVPEPEEEAVADAPLPTLLADRLLEGTLVADLAVDTSTVASVTVRRRQPAAAAAALAHHLAEQISTLAEAAALIQPGAVAVNPDGTAYRLTEDGTWAVLTPEREDPS